MDTGKISLGKLLALLIFMVGIQSAWADVWDGTTKTPAKTQKIGDKDYFLIESAANLAWFSDTVNIYAAKEIAKAYSADSLARANMTAADTTNAPDTRLAAADSRPAGNLSRRRNRRYANQGERCVRR